MSSLINYKYRLQSLMVGRKKLLTPTQNNLSCDGTRLRFNFTNSAQEVNFRKFGHFIKNNNLENQQKTV